MHDPGCLLAIVQTIISVKTVVDGKFIVLVYGINGSWYFGIHF